MSLKCWVAWNVTCSLYNYIHKKFFQSGKCIVDDNDDFTMLVTSFNQDWLITCCCVFFWLFNFNCLLFVLRHNCSTDESGSGLYSVTFSKRANQICKNCNKHNNHNIAHFKDDPHDSLLPCKFFLSVPQKLCCYLRCSWGTISAGSIDNHCVKSTSASYKMLLAAYFWGHWGIGIGNCLYLTRRKAGQGRWC